MRAARVESGSLSDMPTITGKEKFVAWSGLFHDDAAGVNELDVRVDLDKRYRRALVEHDLQAVGQQPHHRGRLHPGNLLQLLLAQLERHEEDVAIDVAAITSSTCERETLCVPEIAILSLESRRKRQEPVA